MTRKSFCSSLCLALAALLPASAAAAPLSGRAPSAQYYTGDYRVSLELYSFNVNLNAYLKHRKGAPPISPADAIKWAKTAGFDAVDITAYYLPGYDNTTMPTVPKAQILAAADEIKALTRQLGLGISGTGIFDDFADPDASRVALDVQRAEFWIDIAAEMGAPELRVFSGSVPADIDKLGWAKIAQTRIVPALRQVADYGAAKGVRIGLQNHGDMTATAAQTIQIAQWVASPNFDLIDDTGYFRPFQATTGANYPWYSDIAAVLPYSGNAYVKLKPAGEDSAAPLMDFKKLFTSVRASGYQGYLPLERLWDKTDPDNPKTQKTPPYSEISAFLAQVRTALDQTKTPPPGS
jgi:hypothetical protein